MVEGDFQPFLYVHRQANLVLIPAIIQVYVVFRWLPSQIGYL